MMKKNILVAILAAVVLSFVIPSPQAHAATIEDSLFGDTQPKMKDGKKANYNLDVTTVPDEDDDQNAAEEAISNAKDFLTGKTLKDGFRETFLEFMNSIADLIFQYNIFLTTATIKVLDLAFNYTIINKIIDKIDSAMVALTGINSSGFTNKGLIGSFVGIASVLTAVVAVYLFVWKRAAMGAFKTLGSTILVMAVALLFFSQYAVFLKGMNQLATEVSQIVLTSPSKITTDTPKTGKEIREGMFKNLQDQFIHRPYLFMQYGTDNESKIGEKRINELLALKPGEKRQKYVEEQEVAKKKNLNMTYANVTDRIIFTGYYMLVNTLNGTILIILSLALVVVQFWFIVLGCVAPFAFAWAMFPNQGGVLKNYSFRLSEPLLIKIMLSLVTFVFFTISTLSYQLDLTSASSYFETSLSQLAIYVLMLILGGKIRRIFKTSKEFRYMMSEMKQFRKSMTNSVATVAQVATTAAGAYLGGPQGAVAGYKAGEAVKQVANSDNSDSDSTESYESADKDVQLAKIPDEIKKNDWVAPEIVDWQNKGDKQPELSSIPKTEKPERPAPEKVEKEGSANKNVDQSDEYVELVPLADYYDEEEEINEEAVSKNE